LTLDLERGSAQGWLEQPCRRKNEGQGTERGESTLREGYRPCKEHSEQDGGQFARLLERLVVVVTGHRDIDVMMRS
jgi:hypothetical protein